MPEPLRYASGEEIRKGDRLRYDEHPGIVEFAAFDVDDPEQRWYLESCGIGVMVNVSQIGSVYTTAIEGLELICRHDEGDVREHFPNISPLR
jgi:hypothetical protein